MVYLRGYVPGQSCEIQGGDRGMVNALLVYPENPVTFWSFDEALKISGKKSAFPPLGLLTIAGMLPETYNLRLVDMNVTPLREEDLTWADIVLTSSMIIHWRSLEEVIARCNRMGVPVLNGGPLPTQYYEEIEGEAGFYLGEGENGFVDVVERMVADPGSTKRTYIDRRGKFRHKVKYWRDKDRTGRHGHGHLYGHSARCLNDYKNTVVQQF